MMSLGKGVIYSKLPNQKIDTIISTAAELVVVDEHIPDVLWSRKFLEVQVIRVEYNIIFQDNQSYVLKEKKEKNQSGSALGTSIYSASLSQTVLI